MHRNRSVNVHQFSMIPSAQIPRSSFRLQHNHKTTFDAGYLIPVFCEEVLPGDRFNCTMTAFARLATPIVPIMDNLYLESFFFFVPNRLVWTNWIRFMGEQDNPADSISYNVPSIWVDKAYLTPNSFYDYLGLPNSGQITTAGTGVTANALPFRAYNLIWNEWFRDENLQNSVQEYNGDTGGSGVNYTLLRRGKRHDYFTSALPWTQKGTAVQLPLGTSAPVLTSATQQVSGAQAVMTWRDTTGATPVSGTLGIAATGGDTRANNSAFAGATALYPSNLVADLSSATAATINQIRQAFQIQRLLERDARGGTRYTEIVRSHFGVLSPDARLQRPEYLGGGCTPIAVNPIAQTSGTGLTGGTTPLGFLSAMGQVTAHHGFTGSFTEHGYILGLVSVRADLTYQQGLRKHWFRKTRYDYYFPVFAMLGEQAILNKEIYMKGNTSGTDDAQDIAVFGYQERWAEYRYHPSRVSGLFNSMATGTLDSWHLAQKFTALPTLNSTFISDTPPVDRIVATTPSTGKQFLFDGFFDIKAARPLPMYSVPGLVDHF